MCTRIPGGHSQGIYLRAGHIHRGAKESLEPRTALDRGHSPVPIGVSRHKDFGKHNQLGPAGGSLRDQPAGLLDCGFGVKVNRCGLDGRRTKLGISNHRRRTFLIA